MTNKNRKYNTLTVTMHFPRAEKAAFDAWLRNKGYTKGGFVLSAIKEKLAREQEARP
jgi:hypothetical protein